MSLISAEYLVFFVIVVALFFAIPQRFRWILLLIASYFFYMWWDPKYAILIMTTTVTIYITALLMRNRPDSIRKLCVILGIAVNVGILFLFKYFNFFNNTIRDLLALFGGTYTPPVLSLLLPVGISYYTFQALSYTIDVYRGTREPERHFGILALYLCFFPTLLSGPIERSTRLLPQLYRKVEFNYDRVVSGLILMGWGFFQKLVIADRVAMYVNLVYESPQRFTGLPLLMAANLFNIQLLCDFSGYTDIAIGTALVMGYELMPNFKRPFLSKSIGELWRRWHMSLMSWFRDYLYIPLGGNRVSKARWHFNTLLVFAVSGLWHGAQWTFVVWGVLNGVFVVFGRITQNVRLTVREAIFGAAAKLPAAAYGVLAALCAVYAVLGGIAGMGSGGRIAAGAAALALLAVSFLRTREAIFVRFLGGLKSMWMMFVVFQLFALAFVFFRARTLADAWYIITHFPGTNVSNLRLIYNQQELGMMLLVVVVIFTVHYIQERYGSIRQIIKTKPLLVRWTLYYLLVMSIFIGMLRSSQLFIYFQF